MFKKNLNNFVNVKNILKKVISITSCSILSCIPNIAYAHHINTNIIDSINAEDQSPFVIKNNSLQYVSDFMYMEATAYSPDEGGVITASGHSLYDVIGWGCASNDFPIGTQLYIECPSAPWINGTYTVLDTGGMGYGVIDIAMSNIDECYEFGRRTIYVTIL